MEDSGFEVKYYQLQFINEDILKKFEKSDFNSVDLVLFSDRYQINKQTGVSYDDIQKIQNNLLKIFSSIPLNAQTFFYERCSISSVLSSGSDIIDEVLDGGFLTGEIYEFFGAPSSGKSQIAMSCSLNVASEYNQNVIYIDSSNSFSPSRIVEIYNNKLSHFNENNHNIGNPQSNPNEIIDNDENTSKQEIFKILDRIKVSNCYDASNLVDILNQINYQLDSDKKQSKINSNLKMIVIDSIGTLLSPVLGGKQTQGHFVMMNISRLMKTIANEYQVVFIVLNNTVLKSNNSNSTLDNENKLALGESWLAISNHQLMIHHKYTDDDSEERSISVEKSTRIRKVNQFYPFVISPMGIA